MALRDSVYSYVHLQDQNHVIYMEKWQDDPLPFNDIDTQILFEQTSNLFPQFLIEEEEEGEVPVNSATFGAKVYKNRKLLKQKTWSDLGAYEKFLDENSNLHKKKDTTILKPVYNKQGTREYDSFDADRHFTITEFLSNGYGIGDSIENMLSPADMVNDSMMGNSAADVSAISTTDLLAASNNTWSMNMRSNSDSIHQNNIVQTPRSGRSRQPSNDRIFQTPVTRIMR
ncbi:Piso0_001647 [Millerozyma farinosa CBS 7064]|uniref:Piso0_001647 protein n=1 Tax=Pichia sorbitophila (strain ATCC MYA-4447 / BCRC 22081 / CBS 7064 / NBRC 10061 / NRRL Y-12695) TaxID=559304 RepID=G8YLC4_PICSO|nr:Piso0_001647 [Millerozyma farinosa CBS 7064]